MQRNDENDAEGNDAEVARRDDGDKILVVANVYEDAGVDAKIRELKDMQREVSARLS